MESFAKQFLIDKIVLELDAMSMSTFFYKNALNDILKTGPLWDYDRAFGSSEENYRMSIGNFPNGMSDWYMELYQDEEFKSKIITYYKQLLPFMKEILDRGIDEYAGHISSAVKMDAVLWPLEEYQSELTSYLEYESYIKYLKYYLTQRLNYLNEIWEINEWEFKIPISSEEEYEVQFVLDDGTILERQKIREGETVEDLWQLDEEKYSGWVMNEGKTYSTFIPIYEDVVLNAERKFENLDDRMAYKTDKLSKAEDILEYMKIVEDKDFSVCIFMDGSSEITKKKEVVDGIKKICDYKYPDWLDRELSEKKNYFLVMDNGWNQLWDGSDENLKALNTTFGILNYYVDSGEVYLYLQEREYNYLSPEARGPITFIVINRYTGEIVNEAIFF